MGDFAKCKNCGAIFEKDTLHKNLGKWTKGWFGKQKYCSVQCREKAKSSP